MFVSLAVIHRKDYCIKASHAVLDTFVQNLFHDAFCWASLWVLTLQWASQRLTESFLPTSVQLNHFTSVLSLSSQKTSAVALPRCCILLCVVSEETSVTQ